MKTIISLSISVLLLLHVFIILFPVEICYAAGDTRYVDDDYDEYTAGWEETHFDNIQDAITAANSGETIIVYSGTYNADIIISKTLTISGENKNTVIISGTSGHVVEITANSVILSGFTIQNAVEEFYDCIMMNTVQNCEIINNIVKGSDEGIYLKDSHGNIISGNSMEGNNYGIGIAYSSSNTIQSNTIQNNVYGVHIQYSSNNIISGNTITENTQYGIELLVSTNSNEVIDNTISNSGHTGIHVTSSANNNEIYNNDFPGSGGGGSSSEK